VRTFGRFAVTAALLALLARDGRADVTSADKLVTRGIELRREHLDAEALDHFRRALSLDDNPRARAQLALAEQALGRWMEADRDLRVALGASKNDWIVKNEATLRAARDSIAVHLGVVEISCNVSQAHVWLNGVDVGPVTDAPFRALGDVHIELRTPSYVSQSRSVRLDAGATSVQSFELVPVEQAPPPPVELGRLATKDIALASSVGQKQRPMQHRAIAWAALGGATASLAAAITAQILRERYALSYNDDQSCLIAPLSREQRCGYRRGQAVTAQAAANVGFGVAGALTAVAAVLLFWPARGSTEVQTSWTPDGSWQVGVHTLF